MTALRPEREGRPYEPYVPSQQYAPQDQHEPPDPYKQPEAFEAAVGQLSDPLNDPLPGRAAPAQAASQDSHADAAQPAGEPAEAGHDPARQGSPWFRPHLEPEQTAQQPPARPSAGGSGTYGPSAPRRQRRQVPGQAGPNQGYPSGYESYTAPAEPRPEPYAPTEPFTRPKPSAPAATPAPVPTPSPVPEKAWDDETMALRQAEKPGAGRDADAVSRETDAAPSAGGRAARRKAAQEAAKRGGKHGRHGAGAAAAAAAAERTSASAPTSRLEARRAARAAKDSPSLIISRAVGEVFITLGVLMLLFVTYQLWWTNVLAEQEAGGAANTLQNEWDHGGQEKKNLAAGERFAIMYIPKLDVKAPVAEGIDKHSVLDRGMVGHYDKSSGIKTAMPWDKKGNFSVAGHRNTHGEPFRYVNKLTKGDKIVVETKTSYYTYEMESILPQTSPSNTSVIGPVPPGSGFTGPGRYITLTTCTPEFTSTYRMIVWGKMVEERPRSKGKPDALVS